jgi:SPP1 gp7 family putative phage head morphogenesis protein
MSQYRELKPVREKPSEYDRIRKEIMDVIRREIFIPLLKEIDAPLLDESVLKNAQSSPPIDELLDAIRSGRITFWQGKFRGRLNSAISKELKRLGAEWDKSNRCFALPKAKLNREVRKAIDISENTFKTKIKKTVDRLDKLDPENIAKKIKLEGLFDTTLFRVNEDFKKSVQSITVAPQLTQEQRKRIAEEYAENLRLSIRGWLKKDILELRQKMMRSTFEGVRYEQVIDLITTRYGVSYNKAKFLARQETNLLLSKFKETRYAEAGVKLYKWRCVLGTPTHPTRPRHKELSRMSDNGKVFQFDKPPRTSEDGTPPRYNNPGEDFNCRCVSIPVVKI